MGHTFGYHYDKARRLVGLTNENGARYRFAYDVLDRLIAESGFDHKLTGYRYNAGNELVEQREFGDAPPRRQTDGAAGRTARPQKRRYPAFRRPRQSNPAADYRVQTRYIGTLNPHPCPR
nr:RHS repeat domain-containing protein [Neisseria sicca]